MFDTNYYGTEGQTPTEGLAPRPDLCHKCGKCCRSATTYQSHTKLQEWAAQGNAEAIEFLNVFEPYESIEAASAVEPEQIAQVTKTVAKRDDMKVEDLTFYHCRYVTPEGLCGIYERRPSCCRRAPDHGWSMMPPGCGFEGWQFEQREAQKRLIRDLKQQVFMLEQFSPDGVTHPTRPDTTLQELRDLVAEKIRPWKAFGADTW